MTNEGSSSLSFSMKESIWLDRGKRVDELMSLSLEPDITIDESEEEVTLKGILVLNGEYRPNEREEQDDNGEESLASRALFRSIEEVTLSEEGVGEIRHHFPIDITIPKERIERLENIDVQINEFDYRFPDSTCLEISAELSIHGVRSEEPITDEAEKHGDLSEENAERSFSFEQVRNELEDKEYPEAIYHDEREESYIPEAEEEIFQKEVKREPRVVFKSSKSEDKPKLAEKEEVSEESLEVTDSSWNESEDERKKRDEERYERDNIEVNTEEINVDYEEEANDDVPAPIDLPADRSSEEKEETDMELDLEYEMEEDVRPEPVVVFKGDKTEDDRTTDGTDERNKNDEVVPLNESINTESGIKNNEEEIYDEQIEDRDLDVRSAKEAKEAKEENKRRSKVEKVETETEEVTNEQVERDDSSEEVEDNLEEDGEEEEQDRENALYLTKMLSDKDGEAYSKLRMCIVQEGESLDVIAKRYSIEVSQLKRMNRLKDEAVSDGQILYIPVRQSS